MSKLRGWAEKGCKSFTEALGFRTKRITLIGGYCYGTKELIAPMEYDGYTNTEVFLSWVEHCLCKQLKSNQIVIMSLPINKLILMVQKTFRAMPR
ncbi:UNKNOWN [Stylonychia lemnae]|uniref:Uncharacterized protein n=1 Tax=Stylonychia lemnae TaxID=5949 RepID=A0A078AEE7_STYLE|nr:UNKNOWN [Stylonychia lemnae]|eukprot:CDW80639.1 UNKNOWN [Stylonychia lemnae]